MSTTLSKEELIEDDIRAGVEKWGESERKGVEKMARRKSHLTLQAEYELRHGTYDHEKSIARSVKAGEAIEFPEYGLDGNS